MTLLPIAVPFSPKSERILDMSGSFFLQGLTGVPLYFANASNPKFTLYLLKPYDHIYFFVKPRHLRSPK